MISQPRYNGRAGRVCSHLAGNPNGVTLRALIDAVEPGCDRNRMWGTVVTLEGQGKACRTIVAGVVHFYPTPRTLVDGRAVANEARHGKPRAIAVTPAPRQRRQVDLPQPANVPVSRALGAATPHRSALNALHAGVNTKRLDREQLATDVDAFLASGGVIQRLSHGDTAESLRAQQEKFAAERRRRSEIPQTRRARRAA